MSRRYRRSGSTGGLFSVILALVIGGAVLNWVTDPANRVFVEIIVTLVVAFAVLMICGTIAQWLKPKNPPSQGGIFAPSRTFLAADQAQGMPPPDSGQAIPVPDAAQVWTTPGRSIIPSTEKEFAAVTRHNRGPILADNLKIDVILQYQNSIGPETKRTVTVLNIMGTLHHDASLTLDCFNAWCHLRDAERTFRFERVEEAFDPANGEAVRDFPAWLAQRAGRVEYVRDLGHST